MNNIAELKDISVEINTEHEIVVNACKSAVEHAIKAGDLLTKAKSMVNHGQWIPWLKDNFTFSERTAQAYMRLAREYPKLEASNPQRVTDLSMREALCLLSNPNKSISLPLLRLGNACKLSTNLRDGRLIVISPSALHDGYYFVEALDGAGCLVEGLRRPIQEEYVPVFLDVLNIPNDTLWFRDSDAQPIENPIWMKTDNDKTDYSHCIKLGIVPEALA